MNTALLSFLFTGNTVFDPMTLLGVGFAMHIEALVEYLKANWFLPKQAAPYAATLLSLLVQVAICLLYHIPLSAAMVGTIATTAATCWWHEITTK